LFVPKLNIVERNLYTTTEFANHLIVRAIESPFQKAIRQRDIIHDAAKTGNPDKGIDFASLKHSGNLDFVIAVDLAGCVL